MSVTNAALQAIAVHGKLPRIWLLLLRSIPQGKLSPLSDYSAGLRGHRINKRQARLTRDSRAPRAQQPRPAGPQQDHDVGMTGLMDDGRRAQAARRRAVRRSIRGDGAHQCGAEPRFGPAVAKRCPSAAGAPQRPRLPVPTISLAALRPASQPVLQRLVPPPGLPGSRQVRPGPLNQHLQRR
jgi:hypothetical protein